MLAAVFFGWQREPARARHGALDAILGRFPEAGRYPCNNAPADSALMAAIASAEHYERNLALVRDHLLKTRGLPLSPVDPEWIERVFRAFQACGSG